MKTKKVRYKRKRNGEKEEILNTNEVMHDYEFHVRMFLQQQKLDFENQDDSEEITPTA